MDEGDRKLLALLEQAGVILRRVALAASEQVGVGLIVPVAIKAHEHTPDWLASFAKSPDEMPEVMDASRMVGRVDDMLRVAVAGMAELEGFYNRLIAAVPLKNATSRATTASPPCFAPCFAMKKAEGKHSLSASGRRVPGPPAARTGRRTAPARLNRSLHRIGPPKDGRPFPAPPVADYCIMLRPPILYLSRLEF